jgi:ribosomal protein L12E/L44/L45/RPP1/RPP2
VDGKNSELTIGAFEDTDVKEIMWQSISKLPTIALATAGKEGKFSNVIAIIS